jgi:hypothetical protein
VVAPPDDVPVDHTACSLWLAWPVLFSAKYRNAVNCASTRFKSGRIRRRIGDLDVVRLRPGPDPAVPLGGQARVVADDAILVAGSQRVRR